MAIMAGGCASAGMGPGYAPTIDPQTSQHPDKYARDLADCQALASGVRGGTESAATQGVIGGAVGAALGAAVGAIFGHAKRGAATGAAVGGIGGIGKGAVEGTQGQEMAIRECLRARGYTVLG